MQTSTFKWSGHRPTDLPRLPYTPDLVLFFGGRAKLQHLDVYEQLRAQFGSAHILGCSTGGQIFREDIVDDDVAGAAIKFETTRVRMESVEIARTQDSRDAGVRLARALAGERLAAVFILSDGLIVNGSQFVDGLMTELPPGCSVSGGLAGDGANFEHTLVSAGGRPRSGLIAAVGFFGSDIRIGHGCSGGWEVFGPKRRVTKSEGNILYELDSEPALDLYERYLGPEETRRLPSSALLYPLQFVDPDTPQHTLVRTVLAVDTENRCMTFAGDLPPGSFVQLMRGNMDNVASAGGQAGRQVAAMDAGASSLSVLVSCIGRRLMLGQRAVDEVEACLDELATPANAIGFYSYGEIAPHNVTGRCDLHNQTMTITTIAEA